VTLTPVSLVGALSTIPVYIATGILSRRLVLQRQNDQRCKPITGKNHQIPDFSAA
jgi:hypothetical protein